jgi:hypothetical protein
MAPVPRYPFSVGVRRGNPVARDPDIAAAVPAVITADPDPSAMGAWARVLDHDRRRTDADIDMLRRC